MQWQINNLKAVEMVPVPLSRTQYEYRLQPVIDVQVFHNCATLVSSQRTWVRVRVHPTPSEVATAVKAD